MYDNLLLILRIATIGNPHKSAHHTNRHRTFMWGKETLKNTYVREGNIKKKIVPLALFGHKLEIVAIAFIQG